ncbi:uncharacterized protein LOC124532362 [Vanessa cardui]|uniref:uncharacterized protein LOC124532362 n=1 Tax=Vanessa cardui TaxID=171605 RepID=UPI001F12B429|nr:uncharacterized protein LOC124532362 [Vanessa cardui]
MKLSGIIFTFLYIQVSSSLLGDFRNAMFNVERGFGKLLTDVVTDVKDTIHCTISAVEQVLVLNGLLDKTSSYSYSCRGVSKPIETTPSPPKIRDQRSLLDDFQRLKHSNLGLDYRNSPRHISMELGKSIANVNKTINDILGHHKTNSNLHIVSKTMKEETNRLTEISKILKRELDNISSNIKNEIRKLLYDRQESNFESVFDEIKTLHDIQQRSINDTEIGEIRDILDKVVNKLHLKSENQRQLGSYNLKEIRKSLEIYSDGQDQKIQKYDVDHSILQDLSFETPSTKIPLKSFKDVAKKIFNQEKNIKSSPSHSEESIFNFNVNSFEHFTPFSTTDNISKKTIDDAKKIIEDSQRTDKILDNIFNEKRAASSVFSSPELFDFS